jgi:hypothetical protein
MTPDADDVVQRARCALEALDDMPVEPIRVCGFIAHLLDVAGGGASTHLTLADARMIFTDEAFANLRRALSLAAGLPPDHMDVAGRRFRLDS